MTFEEQVAEALLVLPMPRRSHSVEVVKNILAPRVAAALRVTAHHRSIGGSLTECDALALKALAGVERAQPA